MPSYYSCDGTVTNIAGGIRCSTGWQTYTPSEPQAATLELTGEFVTYEQGQAFMSGFILLIMTILLYKKLSEIR